MIEFVSRKRMAIIAPTLVMINFLFQKSHSAKQTATTTSEIASLIFQAIEKPQIIAGKVY